MRARNHEIVMRRERCNQRPGLVIVDNLREFLVEAKVKGSAASD